jgi:hypothetical protein
VEHDADREDVHPRIGRASGQCFRRHVGRRPDQAPRRGQARRGRRSAHEPGDAEIGDLRAAAGLEEDVLRLDVAVLHVVGAEVVNRDDARVGEARQRLGLALESLRELLLADESLGQELHGDEPIEAEVACPPHDAHAAAADLLEQLDRGAHEGGRDLRFQQALRTDGQAPLGKGQPAAATAGRQWPVHASASMSARISASASPSSSTVASTSSRTSSR